MDTSNVAGAFVWDGMGSLPQERREFDGIFHDYRRLSMDGIDGSVVAGALSIDIRLQDQAELPMAWNLKPSQWGQPLTFQAHPLRSRGASRQ